MEILLTKGIVYDKNNTIVGHEISFFAPDAREYRTMASLPQFVINIMVQKIQAMVKKTTLFLQFRDSFLISVLPFKFDKENTVVVLDDKMQPDRTALESLVKLHNSGYSIMLGDFLIHNNLVPFVEYANIFKINIHNNKLSEIKTKYVPLLDRQIYYCAAQINSYEEYLTAQKEDYSFYKGDFFLKPSLLNADKCKFLNFLVSIFDAADDASQLLNIMKKHEFLKTIFLSFVNTSFINKTGEQLLTVNHGANYIGAVEVSRWLFICSIRYIATHKPREVFQITLARAKFCEMIASKVNGAKSTYNFFLAAILSTLDVLLDIPINNIINDLPISETFKKVLYSDYLINDVYELANSYERGDWNGVQCYVLSLGISYTDLFIFYQESTKWTEEYIACLEALERKYKRDVWVL